MMTDEQRAEFENRKMILATFLGVPVEKLADALKDYLPGTLQPQPIGTYHDVEIGCNNYLYRTFDAPYNYHLHCTRTGGWEYWDVSANEGRGKRIGGEYESMPFEVRLHDQIICHNRFVAPAQLDKSTFEFDAPFRIGEWSCPVIWQSWERTLSVFIPEKYEQDIGVVIERLVAYIKRFGGVAWAGYFWTCDTVYPSTSPDRLCIRLKLTEPKTDC